MCYNTVFVIVNSFLSGMKEGDMKKDFRGKASTKQGLSSITGRLSMHYDGYGFVESSDDQVADVFIPARYMGDAMHGDTVVVDVQPPDGEGRLEGRIRSIEVRARTMVIGRLERAGKHWQIVPDDTRVRHTFGVTNQSAKTSHEGRTVAARILVYPGDGERPMAEIVRTLPERGTLSSEVEVVIAKQELPVEFPERVLEEADQVVRDWQTSETFERVDVRDVPLVTIDGENAKDFDDAIAVEETEKGWRLTVAIADVGYFVRPGSLLDAEAFERGTSVYFPDRVIPMLPPVLSENVCSLRPHEDRFCLVAFIDFNHEGDVIKSSFAKGIMNSHARLTYTFVHQLLDRTHQEIRSQNPKLVPHLERMETLAKLLRQKRFSRGSIDFDLPEPQIIMDIEDGGVENIVVGKRYFSHMLIEEFMIAANEAVARHLTDNHRGCIYRIHDRPDEVKIREFADVLAHLGISAKLRYPVKPKDLAMIVDRVKGRPEERMLNHMLLRSMAQAQYSPKNVGHFGLASTCYCHFTSPIRRYPDLTIHRLTTSTLKSYNPTQFHQTEKSLARQGKREALLHMTSLGNIATQSSQRERRSMETERECAKLFVAFFMKDKVGEEFDGIISYIAKFGFFVELSDFFVEGLVRASDLEGGKTRFDPKRRVLAVGRQSFEIGDEVRIRVAGVDIEKRDVIFTLLERT